MPHSLRTLALIALLAASSCAGGEGSGSADETSVAEHASETHGAIQVASAGPTTGDWFDVFQNGTRAISGNPPLLGSTIELLPGIYQVRVNKTERTITVEAGRVTILHTGALMVEGEPQGAMWFPIQDGEQKLVSNPPILNTEVALFAGRYDVIVYEGVGSGWDTLEVAEVLPGRLTTVRR